MRHAHELATIREEPAAVGVSGYDLAAQSDDMNIARLHSHAHAIVNGTALANSACKSLHSTWSRNAPTQSAEVSTRRGPMMEPPQMCLIGGPVFENVSRMDTMNGNSTQLE
jgi:hypothetical protein